MEMDTAPEVLVEALEDDEDEPCCFESDVIFPVESGVSYLQVLTSGRESSHILGSLQVDSPPPSQIHELCRMASEEASCTAWHMMLQQGTVFDCLGAGKNVAQALFTAVCSPGTAPEEVQTAFEELTKCLKLQKGELSIQSCPSHPNILKNCSKSENVNFELTTVIYRLAPNFDGVLLCV